MSTTLPRRLVSITAAVCVTVALVALSSPSAQAAAPSNDNFAAATVLPAGTSGTNQVYGSTVDATTEPGEPSHHPDGVTSSGSSIWYSYTPVSDGNLYLAVAGATDFDPVISVYTGSSLANLVRVAANDDAVPDQSRSNVLWMPATSGTTYHIAIGGKSGSVSWTRLTYGFSDRPGNDDTTSASTLSANWSVTTWNAHATAQPGEPQLSPPQPAAKTLWWRYSPDHNGTLSVTTTGSTLDTVLAVFVQGSTPFSFPELTRLASNDDANPSTSTSAVSGLALKAGRTYWIAVDGYQGAEGMIVLSDTWTQSSHPDNDVFADAATLSSASSFSGSTATATVEANEPAHLSTGSSGKSVWYRFVAATDGTVDVDLAGTDFDAVAAFYRGTSLTSLVKVAEDRGATKSPPRPTRLTRVPVEGGGTYYLAIAGAGGDSGTLAGSFHSWRRPSVASLAPGGGPLAGGNWIDIHGAYLDGADTTVRFGSVPAQVTSGEEDDSTTVVHAKVPADLPAGPTAVTVATAGGTAAGTLTYIVGQPSLTALSARYVRLGGGQQVQVTGVDFAGTPSVSVGGVPATGVAVLSSTSLTFVTPKHAAGAAEVRVTTSSGTTATVTAGWLTYLDQPKVTHLSRKKGSRHGGYRLTVTGKNFVEVSKVLVGSKPAKYTLKGGRLSVVVPKSGKRGTVYVRVVTPVGTSAAAKAAKFRYR